MRLADVIMSFPSLLLAVIVLYMLEPSILNLVLVLAITRIPIYLRTTRAEVLEIRERMFVQAARVMGASDTRIVLRHILPMVLPTLVTIATLDFAFVMLAESSLSFLGIGIQPPEVTWGLMVAQGRPYLAQAWWLASVPGPRDRDDDDVAEPAVGLDAHRARSGPALAAGSREHAPMADHVLEVSGPLGRVPHRPRPRPGGEGRQLPSRPRRDARHPRRKRLGQVGVGLGDHEPDRLPAGRHHRRRDPLRRRDLLGMDDEKRRADQRPEDRHDLPGPAGPSQPGLHRSAGRSPRC